MSWAVAGPGGHLRSGCVDLIRTGLASPGFNHTVDTRGAVALNPRRQDASIAPTPKMRLTSPKHAALGSLVVVAALLLAGYSWSLYSQATTRTGRSNIDGFAAFYLGPDVAEAQVRMSRRDDVASGEIVFYTLEAPISVKSLCVDFYLYLAGDARLTAISSGAVEVARGSVSLRRRVAGEWRRRTVATQTIQGRACKEYNPGNPAAPYGEVHGKPVRPWKVNVSGLLEVKAPALYPAQTYSFDAARPALPTRRPADGGWGVKRSIQYVSLGAVPQGHRVDASSSLEFDAPGTLSWHSSEALEPWATLASSSEDRVRESRLFLSGALIGISSGSIFWGADHALKGFRRREDECPSCAKQASTVQP